MNMGSIVDALQTVMVAITIKGTIVLLLTMLVARVARHAPAATLHRIWMTGLVAVLLLPAVSLVMPKWSVPFVPSLAVPERTPVRSASAPDNSTALPAEAVAQAMTEVVGNASQLPVTRVGVPAWSTVLLLVWGAGMFVVLARLAVGTPATVRRARHARLTDDSQLLADVQRVARSYGVHRPIAVLQSTQPSVPATWGTLHPVLLLPPDVSAWSVERRRLVVLHEVAHIARLDSFTQLLAQCAAGLSWFHPLVWFAIRRAQFERERACDDFVLANGVLASRYATDLLDFVQSLPRQFAPGFATLGVTGNTDMNARVRAILSNTVRRDARLRVGSLGAAVALCMMIPLGMLHGTSQQDRASGSAATIASSERAPLPDSNAVFVTGEGMRERVAARNRRGGLALVVEDSARLQSDVARREYLLAILALVGPLGRGELGDMALHAARIDNDVDRVRVLEVVLDMGNGDVAEPVCRATAGMRAASAQASLVGKALMSSHPEAPVGACFEIVQTMEGDTNKSAALGSALLQPDGTDALLRGIAQSARTIVQTEIRADLLARAALHPAATDPGTARVIRAASMTLPAGAGRQAVLDALDGRSR